MYRNKSFLAIIPARGGSKSIPKKNLKKLGNKKLIEWTIQSAQKSKYIDRLILSSDDKEIIKVAHKLNCEVPFKRPKKISSDKSTTVEVISHAILNITESYDFVIVLQPTSPFRNHGHIDGAIKKLIKTKSKSLVSVKKIHTPVELIYRINKKNIIKPILKNNNKTNRQDYETFYMLNGAIYIINSMLYKSNQSLIANETIPYIMDDKSSIDIDTPNDLKTANFLLDKKK